MKIVIDEQVPFVRGVFESVGCRVLYLPGAAIDRAAAADADALIVRTRTRCDRRLLAGSRVKVVFSATIGFDHIATAELADLGVSWYNAPGCNAESVSEYVLACLLNVCGSWRGRTLGVVGVGHVGRRVAAWGRILGMRVLLNDPPRAEREGGNFVTLEQLAAESDVISMHVPLTTDGLHPTLNLADAGFFAAMRPGSVFINTSRGAAVDDTALKSALSSGKLQAAVLDVWKGEPNIDTDLLARCALATPHIAGYSADGKANGSTAAVRRVAEGLNIPELRDWQAKIPEVADAKLVLPPDCKAETGLRAAVSLSYDPVADDRALRADPVGFENLRNRYRVRREFGAFHIAGGNLECRRILADLGFNLE